MDKLSKQERRELRRQRRKEKKESMKTDEQKGSRNKNIRLFGLFAVIVISSIYLFYVISALPGGYDNFSKCLTESGMVIYGNDWCQNTQKQMAAFGKSEEYLNYVKCDDNRQLCQQKGVEITPTWEINGKIYSGIQSFQTLSEVSGCNI